MLLTLSLFAATSVLVVPIWNRLVTPVPVRIGFLLWAICAMSQVPCAPAFRGRSGRPTDIGFENKQGQ